MRLGTRRSSRVSARVRLGEGSESGVSRGAASFPSRLCCEWGRLAAGACREPSGSSLRKEADVFGRWWTEMSRLGRFRRSGGGIGVYRALLPPFPADFTSGGRSLATSVPR